MWLFIHSKLLKTYQLLIVVWICFHNKKYDEICCKLTWLGINKDTYARNSGTKGSYKWKYDVEYLGYKRSW